jgi:hypothetical protein
MPSYLQLDAEPEWGAQFIPPTMNAGLLGPLRVFYGLGPSAVGSAGDNNHLYGRHRSYNWDKASIYCTNRAYGTTDARDQGGNRNWYRAFDVGIQGQQLFDASRRMDALARSGQCPGLAEWFGTFDGVNVVGWFEGNPSTADSSHLSHLHVGVWNSFADSAATMRQLYRAITGLEVDMPKIVRVNQTGVIAIGNGPIWYRLPSPGAVEAAKRIWGITEEPLPIDQADFAAFGVDVSTLAGGGSGGGDGGLTPHVHAVPGATTGEPVA